MFEKCTLGERIHGINESFIICKCLPQNPLNIQLQLHFKISQFTKNSFYIYCIMSCKRTFISHLLLITKTKKKKEGREVMGQICYAQITNKT